MHYLNEKISSSHTITTRMKPTLYALAASLLLCCCALSPISLCAASAAKPLEEYANYEETRGELRKAEEYLSKEKPAKAAKCYRKAAKLQDAPARKAEFLYREAQCLLKARKIHDARKAYLALLKDHLYYIPLDDVLAQLRELADDFENGRGSFLGISDPQAAIDLYELLIRHEPGLQQSLPDRLALAAKLEKDGQIEKAVDVYQEVIKYIPDDADTRFGLAQLLDRSARKLDSDGALSRAVIREVKRFLEVAPADDPRRETANGFLTRARNHEGARLLERAEFYLAKHHCKPEVARRYLNDLRTDYDDTPAGERAKKILQERNW